MAVDASAPPPSRAVIPVRLLGDPALAARAGAGDESAYGEIYRRFHEPLLRYCRSLLLSVPDAEDAVQSTMAAALRSLPGEKRKIQLRAWLFRVAHNQCIDLLRARSATTSLEEAADVGDKVSVTADAETRARLRDLVADLRSLPPRQRSALVMRELSGLDYAEIGVALETTPATAKQAVFEARVALQEIAEGRDMSCSDVQRTISDGDRRTRKARKLRAHLRACTTCSAFTAAIDARSADLAILAPPVGAAGALSLLSGLFGSAAGSSGVVGKAAAVVAATAAVSAGSLGAIEAVTSDPPPAARVAPATVDVPSRDGAASVAPAASSDGATARRAPAERDRASAKRPAGRRPTATRPTRAAVQGTPAADRTPAGSGPAVGGPLPARPVNGQPAPAAQDRPAGTPAPTGGQGRPEAPPAGPDRDTPAAPPAASPDPAPTRTAPTPTAPASAPEGAPASDPEVAPDIRLKRPF